MPPLEVSNAAKADLDAIVSYTLETWGSQQAALYLAQLEAGLELLAASPALGRATDELHPGLRRFEIAKHVVFYTADAQAVFIVRILHHQMLPTNYL